MKCQLAFSGARVLECRVYGAQRRNCEYASLWNVIRNAGIHVAIFQQPERI